MNKPIKQKKCKSCGDPFTPWSTTAKVCSMACALDHAGKDRAKAQRKEHAVKKREFLANDTGHQRKAAQHAFNAYIRERDKHLGCVSCDKTKDWGGQWHAGHYKSVGARGDLRFNEDNCSRQCSVCNNYLSGNLVAYRTELIKRIGLARVEALEAESPAKRYRAEDYRAIAQEYKAKIKLLKPAAI